MLYRKIEKLIEAHLKSDSKKILLIDGARQVCKDNLYPDLLYYVFQCGIGWREADVLKK